MLIRRTMLFQFCAVFCVGLVTSCNAVAKEVASWHEVVKNADELFVHDDMLVPIASDRKTQQFYDSEAECAANAVALLSVNGLLTSGPASIVVKGGSLSDGAAALFVKRTFSDGKEYKFICLLDRGFRLRRTRVVGVGGSDKGIIVEITNSEYLSESHEGDLQK